MNDILDNLSEEQLNSEKPQFKLSRTAVIRISIFAVLVIFLVAITIQKAVMISKLTDQYTAKRWTENGKGSSSVSMFLHDDVEIDNMTIGQLRYNLNARLKELLDNGLDDEVVIKKEEIAGSLEDRPGFSSVNQALEGPYAYAYSAKGKITIAASNEASRTINDANTIGVGGDFFLFHPIELKTGRYFDDTELMQDAVILDSNSAFRLFGSYDCIDKMVMINNRPFYVRGVYDPDDSKYSVYAGSDGGFIFMHYSELVNSGSEDKISCIEFVSEEPYSGYLYNFLKEEKNTGISKDGYDVVQNTGRFGVVNLLTNVVSAWSERSMKTTRVVYPYWENIARAYENICGIILIIQMVLLALIIIIGTAYLGHAYKQRTFHLKNVYDFFDDIVDKRRVKKYEENKNSDAKEK